jgi:DnaD/phage-associated family protein
MARNLDPQIMSDPWFIELDDRARLGWMMLILNGADDQGRFLLNGRLLKSLLFPADDLPAAEVLAMLEGFAASGKVHAYEKDGVRYGQIVHWWKYQIGSEWMAPSRHPAPEGWIDRWRIHAKGGKGIIDTSPHWSNKKICGFVTVEEAPAQPESPRQLEFSEGAPLDDGDPGTEGNSSCRPLGNHPGSDLPKPLPSSEVKVKDKVKDKDEGKIEKVENPPPAAAVENPFSVYEQNIGPLTPAVAERIKLAEKDYSTAWVVEAIHLSAMRNKRRWDYAEGILRNWHRDGKDDGEKPEKTYAEELAEAGYTLPEEVPAEWLA